MNPAASAASNSAPFFRPFHDSWLTVRTSNPISAGASCRGNCSSSNTRTRRHRFMRCFERSNSLFAGHSWERIQEVVKTVITGQIVDEIAKGHSCAHKNRRAAKNVRIAMNDRSGACHVRLSLLDSSSALALRPDRRLAAIRNDERSRSAVKALNARILACSPSQDRAVTRDAGLFR